MSRGTLVIPLGIVAGITKCQYYIQCRCLVASDTVGTILLSKLRPNVNPSVCVREKSARSRAVVKVRQLVTIKKI